MATPYLSPIDRPGLALANLSAGNLDAAARSLLDPASLSPLEARDLLDRMGVKPERGPMSAVMSTLTNPLVIIGAIVGMRYPVASLANLTKFSAQVQRAASRYTPLSKLRGFTSIFRDRPQLVESYIGALRGTHEFKEKFLVRSAGIIDDFQKSARRQFGPRDQYLAAVLSERLHEGIRGFRGVTSPLSREAVERAADAPLRNLVKNFRGVYDDVFVDTFAGKGNEAALRTAMKSGDAKKVASLIRPDIPAGMKAALTRRGMTLGSYETNYMPRLLARQSLSEADLAEATLEQVGLNERVFGRVLSRAIDDPVAPAMARRKMAMLPDPEDLAKFPEFLNPEKFAQYGREVAAIKPTIPVGRGDVVSRVRPLYSLQFTNTLERYVNSVAGAKGWTLSGHGRTVLNELKALKGTKDFARANVLENTYIPIATGRHNLQQAIAAQQWGAGVKSATDLMNSPTAKKYLPGWMRNWVNSALTNDRGPKAIGQIQGELAGYLYLSTLGANVGSASLNLMQNIMTTYPVLGWRATLKGMERTYQKGLKYFRLRSQGLDDASAMTKAFPDFVESGAAGSPLSDEAVRSAFKMSWDEASVQVPGRFDKGFDKVKQAMMSLFSSTERFNRITAFEGAMWKGAQEGMRGPGLSETARRIVGMTQFFAGPESTPQFLLNRGPLSRQFLRFGAESLNFLTDTATTLGSGAQSGALGRNYGTLGRVALGTGLVYEGGKAAGVDLTYGLAPGALPIPQESNPFYPFPFVPPAIQIAGNLAKAALTGEADPAKRVLPLLVPGGTAATRALGYIPGLGGPDLARVTGRQYADYETRLPTGEIPVYSKDGALQGYETSMQIALRGLGVPGAAGDLNREREITAHLLANRDRIRDARRAYLEALMTNNTRAMQTISKDFQRAYGMKLVIKKDHIRAYQMRRDVPRMERVLASLPPEIRPQFAQAIQQAMLSVGTGFLGLEDPSMLTGGTPSTRGRQAFPSAQASFFRKGTYQQNTGPLDRMNVGNIGRNKLPSTGADNGLSLQTPGL